MDKKRIYIIDDDRDMVESVSMVLKANDYEVGAQYSEENVLENVLDFKPDLIILDVMFPENSDAGFEIARKLKQNEKAADIPIILLSVVNEKGTYVGRFTNQDIDESWLPVSKFLDKPVEPKELIAQVESLLKRPA